jgi:hypothetical protein
MKKLGLLLLLLSNVAFAQTDIASHFSNDEKGVDFTKSKTNTLDTTSIEFTDRGIRKRIKIITDSKKDLDLPTTLTLENVLKKAGVNDDERQKALILIEKENKKDTILVITQDGDKIKIIAKDPSEAFGRSRSAQADTTIQGEHQKNDHWSDDKGYDDNVEKNDDDDDDKKNWRDYTKKSSGSGRYFSKSDFGIYLGLNNWVESNPQAPNMLYGLDTWGSRYFALSWRRNATLVNGKKMDLAFAYGPEIAWNNFMFTDDNVVEIDAQKQVRFVDYGDRLQKSKLVVPTLNFPVLLQFGFEESKFHIGLGGYAGYRIGGYSKIKENGNKDKNRNSYGLNDFRYGLTAELGRKNGLKFFFRYDMNEMFKENQLNAKDLQAWSVGVRF